VRDGDEIELDVAARRLHLCVSDDELAARGPPGRHRRRPPSRGWVTRCTRAHVTQAHEGCDFDFLQGQAGTPEPEIF
jgi:dihydroxyacid dehydratase/phosphogluconate dehydratase